MKTSGKHRHTGMPRLFVDEPLQAGILVVCSAAQSNYLMNVLRLRPPAPVAIFNGRDGLWRAEIAPLRRGACQLHVCEQTAGQTERPDLHYLFAPLKKARLDYMAQKATELGAGVLRPVMTRRTITERVNLERLRANTVEAAEQCEILWIPELHDPTPLDRMLADWKHERKLIFCDEAAPTVGPIAVLSCLGEGPFGVLVGPEGGFAPEERALLLSCAFTHPISLGPRIMRADTAAIAALTLVQATLGDWR